MVHDPKFTKELYTVVQDQTISRLEQYKKIESFPVDWSLSVCIRSVTDERYKFSRYFPFTGFNMPQTLDELIAKNDVELYDLQQDPDELNNLAADFPANKDLIARMNAKLNQLIVREIGQDDGSFLPLKDWINWDHARPGLVNI